MVVRHFLSLGNHINHSDDPTSTNSTSFVFESRNFSSLFKGRGRCVYIVYFHPQTDVPGKINVPVFLLDQGSGDGFRV